MAEAAGKDFVLQIEDTPGGGTYTTLGGLRAKTFTRTHEGIEITNHGSNQDKTFLDAAGIRSMGVSGSGIFDRSATLHRVVDNCAAGTLTNFRLIDSGSGGRTYTGSFHISQFEESGEYNGAVEYNVSLESSGAITVA
jgi:TP901-1 family phage major tail protein